MKKLPPSQKGKHWKLSAETRARQKIAQQKLWDSKKGQERKIKYRLINKGKNNPMFGVKLSDKSKDKHRVAALKMWENMSEETQKQRNKKISISKIGKKALNRNPNSNNFKKGHRLNLGKKFPGRGGRKNGSIPWNKGEKMLNLRGSNHPNWKGGNRENYRKEIESKIEYKEFRKEVFERDNYIDQKSRKRGGKLNIHHILNFNKYPELRLSLDNCITLSVDSHRKFHKKYGFKKNTKEQLIEFLK